MPPGPFQGHALAGTTLAVVQVLVPLGVLGPREAQLHLIDIGVVGGNLLRHESPEVPPFSLRLRVALGVLRLDVTQDVGVAEEAEFVSGESHASS